MKHIVQKISEHKSSTPSRWREEAEYRAANKDWLRYSQHIAIMMLDKMEEFAYNKDNKNKRESDHQKDEKYNQKNLRRGGTDHRERKFRLTFKIP